MRMDIHTTFGRGRWDEQFRQSVAFTEGSETENTVVNLYPEIAYQTWEGFGGAFTEASAYVYAQMTDEQKQQVIRTYFGKERMNYQLGRCHMDSCDFSLGMYEAMSDPQDEGLASFSLERDEKWILPMLRDAMKASEGRLKLMLTPWSPPAFMKTNGSRVRGGKLKEEYRGLWAEYLCRYILSYREMGFTVERISLQNEPKAVQTWDSCIFTAEEEKVFLRDFMYPAMERHGLTDVEVFLWDHNKERVYEWMRDIIDEDTDRMVAGAAFHWYSGDHFEALDLCRSRFPGKKLIESESCVEFSKYDAEDAIGAAMMLSHEVMGDLNHGVSAFYDWNLIVDEKGGPNHVKNYCLAPYIFDTRTGELRAHLLQQVFEHFSATIVPGSVRIACTSFSEQVEATAFRRPGGELALVLLNRSASCQPVVVRLEGREASLLLQPTSLTSGVVLE